MDPLGDIAGRDFERTLHDAGADIFVEGLKNARMTRFLGGSKVNRIGFVLAGGGFLLRFAQSSLMPGEEFAEAADRWAQLIAEDRLGRGRWAWDNFGL